MIEDEIVHQREPVECIEIVPCAELGIDVVIIDYAVAVVAGARVVGEHVDGRDQVAEMGGAEAGEMLQGRSVGIFQMVRVSDEHNVPLIEERGVGRGGWRCFRAREVLL